MNAPDEHSRPPIGPHAPEWYERGQWYAHDDEPDSPRETHLAEMRDLAERILANEEHFKRGGFGQYPAIAVELAELVRHYDPEGE